MEKLRKTMKDISGKKKEVERLEKEHEELKRRLEGLRIETEVKNFQNIRAQQRKLDKQETAIDGICGKIDRMKGDIANVKRSTESNLGMLGEQILNLLVENMEKAMQEMIMLQKVNSTILAISPTKLHILSPDRSNWKTSQLELPCRSNYGGGMAYMNGEIFIFGGKQMKKNIYKLDGQKEWRQLADMNEERESIDNSSLVFDGCIWVCGGKNNGGSLNTVEKYIPGENRWMQMPSIKEKRRNAAAAVCNGKIYVSGGYNRSYLKTVECFDPQNNTWTMFVDLPAPRAGHAMISDGSCLIVLGGYDERNSQNAVWKLDTEERNPSWKEMPSMKEKREAFASVLLENRIYAIGGQMTKTVGIFDGSKWNNGPALPENCRNSIVIPWKLAKSLSPL